MNIAISCGDVNGIGLEVFFKSLPQLRAHESLSDLQLQLIIHEETLETCLNSLSLPFSLDAHVLTVHETQVQVIPCEHRATVRPGHEELSAAFLAAESLECAAALVCNKDVNAVLTLPVSKTTLHAAGFHYPGQTEFFSARSTAHSGQAEQTHAALMMLVHQQLRVALATVHVSLQSVSALITVALICERVRTLNAALRRDFGCAQPRIAVLSLNPHAGENGHMGHEELTTIQPAVELLRAEGIVCEGPFASDGFFAHGAYRGYDGVLAMYHDQGLIPLKLLAGGAGVNVSANLDIVRVSPDHGTAYALAAKNLADAQSTVQSLCTAAEIVHNRRRFATQHQNG